MLDCIYFFICIHQLYSVNRGVILIVTFYLKDYLIEVVS